ncbi:hypothetical protein DFP73DRAFT_65239 [Morchella snyderi]|nr:hypothetical protein DFP73DRAFT_65239 [Morchella snyderi]
MASDHDDSINTQVFKINKLKTRSVTLYPSRAAVVRDIENVKIKPGRNEITIVGISDYADENTIKVEGHGTSALITDIVVEKIAYSLYAELDEDESTGDEKDPECARLKKEIAQLNESIEDEQERLTSYSNQIAYMDKHAVALSARDYLTSTMMAESMKVYSEFRENVYAEYRAAQNTAQDLRKEHTRKTSEYEKAWERWEHRTKGERAQKEIERKNRPSYVTKVTVTVELDSLPPKTESIESYVSTGRPARNSDDEPPRSKGPSLRISYVTGGASWKPRYDMRLDTTSETAILTYRAEFSNNTGESWTDATVTLSTSQTSFTGLEDKVPWLDSWRIHLQKDAGTADGSHALELYSTRENEKNFRKRKRGGHSWPAFRAEDSSDYQPTAPAYSPPPAAPPAGQHLFGTSAAPAGQHLFGTSAAPAGQNLFGSASPAGQHLFGTSAAGFGNPHPPPKHRTVRRLRSEVDDDDGGEDEYYDGGLARVDNYDDDDDDDDGTIDIPRKMGLALSKSVSYGLTTTYDLPGARNIPHSRLARRHVIKELTLPNVQFSHIAVPKLRAAAFLKARITNSSDISLLRGPCGLTVDGSFLGNSTVERCVPGGTFELSLGIDEEVLVSYRKPVRKMASQGMLSREHVATYERSISVHNAKRKKVKVVLFDQVPVSGEERLKVALLTPKLREEGRMSTTSIKSMGGKELMVEEMLRTGGEIRFTVTLEKGDGVVLPVEYEAKFPIGEHIRQA